MRVLAISGSLRRASWSSRLARAAAELAPEGVEVDYVEGLVDLPNFNEDLEREAPPAAVAAAREAIEAADAILVVTPEYNAIVPGGLKNAIDWASRPHGASALTGKPVAVVSSSPLPFGGTWANEQLRRSLGIPGARVLEQEPPLTIGKVDEKFEGERLADEQVRESLRRTLAELTELAEAAAEQEAVPA